MSLLLDLTPSCLNRLQFELILDGLGDEVVGGARVNECQAEVVTLNTKAYSEVHWHYEVQW